MKKRVGTFQRKTHETSIEVEWNLDGQGEFACKTGVPFMDHMLNQIAKHGLFDLTIAASGDIEVDDHHLVEDLGLCLGSALKEALGKKERIKRFGQALIPLADALVSVAVDLSSRPFLVFNFPLPKAKVGTFDVELIPEFLRAFVSQAGLNLHVNLHYGDNLHHCAEALFKALAKALDQATSIDPRVPGIPSTKGLL